MNENKTEVAGNTTTATNSNAKDSITDRVHFRVFTGKLRAGMAQFIVLVDRDHNVRGIYSGAVNASFVFNDLDHLCKTGEFKSVRDEDNKIMQNGVLLTHGPTDYEATNSMEAWPQFWSSDTVRFFPNSGSGGKPRHEEMTVNTPVNMPNRMENLRISLPTYMTVMERYTECELIPMVLELGNRDKKVERKNTHGLYTISKEGKKDKLVKSYSGKTLIFTHLLENVEGILFPGAGALFDFALSFCAAGVESRSFTRDYLREWLCWEDEGEREEIHAMSKYMEEFSHALTHRYRLHRQTKQRPGFSKGRKRYRNEFAIGRDKGNAAVLNKISHLLQK